MTKDRLMAVNLRGPFLMVKHVVRTYTGQTIAVDGGNVNT